MRVRSNITCRMRCLVRLDSSRTDETGNDWRRPCGAAQRILRCDADGRATLRDMSGQIMQSWESPLDAIAWLDTQRRTGYRWIGYLSYELGTYLEPAASCHEPGLPLLIFSEHELIESDAEALRDSRPLTSRFVRSNFTRPQYICVIQKAIDYIAAGDIFQVNLAQQLLLHTNSSARDIYLRVQQLYPAWYAALLDYGDFALVSNSPELYLRIWNDDEYRRIETRPIKGTRPRREGMREQLASSIKDQAELNMIVDLERNDLGRVCRIGSVKVCGGRQIEEHPTVYHGSATITGELLPGVGLLEILKATFPGGSITGAPKIRAMQIIRELEPEPRGPYCGAIGYLDADGTMQFNIAIRTLVIRGDDVRVPVGGGIVADSRPADEYEETIVKARAALMALGVSEDELPR